MDVKLPRVPIAYIDVAAFSHATEDQNKVVTAVKRILPTCHIDSVVFKKINLRGHYGNPISLFEARIKRGEVIEALIKNLSQLGELDKEFLLEKIDLHISRGSLYIRLDKQSAFQGELKTCSADPIRLRIKFRTRRIEDIVRICRELKVLP